MKINLPSQAFSTTKHQSSRRLPGEPRNFTPKRNSNLTPPQHLGPNNTIISTRDHEVSTKDPIWEERNQLAAKVAKLEAQIQNLEAKLIQQETST